MIDSALHSLEYERIVSLIALEARSDPGRAALARRRPAHTVEECEDLQGRLAEMVRFYLCEGLLPISGLADVEPFLAGDILDLEESWQVVRATRATQALRETFLRSTGHYPLLRAIGEQIEDLKDVLDSVSRYFTKDGKLREDASPLLRSIRSRVHAKRSAIQKSLTELMQRHADSIQEPIITMRGDRFCIPVRAERRNDVPGILHERSGSGASFFIEPLGIVELNNDLADMLMEEREEIARITRFIATELQASAPRILAAVEASGELDAIQACAVMHEILQASRPRFADRHLKLIDGRHPLLDERLAQARGSAFGEREEGRTVVPTTIELGGETPALLISGPNAGGKTVTLKTAGLLVALATSGLPFPAAEGSIVPVVDAVHVLIGDDQSVLGHLSTFSAYLLRLKQILEKATPRSLVLLDELGSGTDPEEGAAIAAATIEYLLSIGCMLISTTHLSALKSFAIQEPRIVNASMEFDTASERPTFRIIRGVPGRSRAIEIAEFTGLPETLIRAARERVGDRYGEVDALLAELQKTRTRMLEEQEQLTRDREEAAVSLRVVQDKQKDIDQQKKKLASQYSERIDQVKVDVQQRLQSEIRKLRESDRESRAKLEVTQVLDHVLAPANELELPHESFVIAVGDRVQHRRMKFTGLVTSIEGKKVQLEVSGKKMQTSLDGLIPLREESKSEKKEKTRPLRPERGDMEPVVAAELNLIGHRVDEALDESDKFLDRALFEGKAAVRLIHGFGTGTLRKALREHLKKHPAVRSFRPGDEREGGDGATVAILDV